MATRDILVLNTTASRAETQQGSDTVVIRGDSTSALSVENSSGTSVLSVDTISSSIDISGDITASGNFSSSLASSASFGRLEAVSLKGNAFNLTDTDLPNTISSSGQIASQISGAFRRGFEFTGTIGDFSPDNENMITASFGRIVATSLSGSAANLTNTDLDNTISGAAQIESNISGSFKHGFEFTGQITSSAGESSKLSVGRIVATTITGDVSNMSNVTKAGMISSSGQIASQISGSFQAGFEFDGLISGSATSTGSFGKLVAREISGDISAMSNIFPRNTVSGSAQIASRISGAFDRGFEFVGKISQNTGVWSEINAMNSVRKEHEAGGNGVNAAIAASGNTPGQPYGSPLTEEWNGTNWSEVNDMIAGIRQGAGGGTTESFIVFGGTQFPATPYYNPTEEYNGTNWSDGANMITGRYDLAGMAENTEKALAIGPTKTEEYNGSAWTEVNDLITGKSQGTAFGDTTETAYFVGATGGSTQYFNGTNWSEVNNTNVQSLQGLGSHGSANDAIIYGGIHYPYSPGALVNCAEAWDGTSWAVRSGLPAAIASVRGAGDNGSTGQLGLAVGGGTPGSTNIVNSWSGLVNTTGSFSNVVATKITGDVSGMTGTAKTGFISGSAQLATSISGSFGRGFTFGAHNQNKGGAPVYPGVYSPSENRSIRGCLGAFSAGGALIVSKRNTAGIGTKAGALVVGGDTNPDPAAAHLGSTEEYNGSSFSEVNDLTTPRRNAMGAGTTEAGIVMGGQKFPSPGAIACTEVYNGTNWSEEADMTYCTKSSGDAGDSSEAAIVFGGNYQTPASHYTNQGEEYNGTAWSEIANLNVSRSDLAGLGNSEAALAVAGEPTPGGHAPGNAYDAEEWDGSTWTSIQPTLNNPFLNNYIKGAGTVNDGHAFGGCYRCFSPVAPHYTYYYNGKSQHWDGIAWAHGGGLIAGRRFGGGDGTSGDNGFYAGGDIGNTAPYTSTCMEVYSRTFITASFGRLETHILEGDASNMTNMNPSGVVSGSAQLAANISGSFNKGFTVSGDISMKPVVFSSGGDLNCAPGATSPAATNFVGATYRGAAGNKNAGLVFGGFRFLNYRPTGFTEEYDGTSWSEKNDMIDAGAAAGGGTSEAAIATGGNYRNCDTEEWNGTNWSEVNHHINDLNCTYKPLSIGNSSEALITGGGVSNAPYGQTETWNGTNWATANEMIHDPRGWHGGAGTQNAGVTAGGPHHPYNGVSCTETWDGTSWTEGGSALISNMKVVSMAGSQNDTLLAGHAQMTSFQGNIFSNSANFSECSICWNGMVWSTTTDLSDRRLGMSAAGSNSDVAFFTSGIDISSPHAFACTIESETFVASASFMHVDAIRVTASVDGMTNIDPPEGAVSGSAQLASNISGSFKKGFEFDGEIASFGAWSQGADFTGCYTSLYGKYGYSAIGTRDAALVSGASGAHQGGVSETYAYNGVAWSDTGHDMIQGGSHSAHGTANAGLAIGRHFRAPGTGYFYTCTEEYNGSAWSETTDLPYKLKNLNNQSAGTQNAALTAGGNCDTTDTLHAIKRHALAWDGLSYSHVGTLAEARDSAALTGTMNAALAQGGGSDSCTQHMNSDSTCTEEWNGSAWSTAAASNFPTGCGVMASGKSSNDSMHVYDASDASLKSDVYNGATWSLGPNMNGVGRIQDFGAAGTTAKSFFMSRLRADIEHFDENHVTSSIGRVDANEFSLESDTDLTVNESLQIPQYATNPPVTSSAGEVWYNTDEEKLYFTYDINAWTSTAELITAGTTQYFGTTGAGIAASRYHYPAISAPHNSAVTEEWNGNAWSETGDTIHCGQSGESSHIAVGTATAGLILGVNIGSPKVQKWNGSAWSEETGLSVGCAYGNSVAGTQNAAVSAGGRNGSHQETTQTVEYNGTSGYAAANMPDGYASLGVVGTQNDSYFWAGDKSAPVGTANCESLNYNGTSWSTGVTTLRNHLDGVAAGTANAALAAGGKYIVGTGDHGGYVCVEEYNGTAWYNVNNLNVAQRGPGGDGSQSSAFAVGKRTGFAMNSESSETEQYTTTGIGCHCIGGV